MKTIQQLCVEYGCDKTPEIGHPYAPIYDKLFTGLEIKSILEIGIGYPDLMEKYVPGYQTGASLKVWRDFFPKAHIYGIDNVPETMMDEPRITTYLGDSTDEAWVKSMDFPQFDIIIDDGNHAHSAQRKTAELFLGYANQMYFIEDVSWPDHLTREFAAHEPERLSAGRGNTLMLLRP